MADPKPRAGRRGRLSRSSEFQRVYREGHSLAGRFLVLYVFRRPDGRLADGPARLGLSVGRKVGGAVERNRVKRILRDAFASLEQQAALGADYVVIARASISELLDKGDMEPARAELSELVSQAQVKS